MKNRDTEATLWFDHGLLLAKRSVYLSGEITNESVTRTIKSLLFLAALSSDPITLLLDSEGGEYYAALSLYDVIRDLEAPVHCLVFGSCMSSAVVVLQACDKRSLYPNCRMLIHDGQEGFDGNTRDSERWAEQAKRDRRTMYEIFALHSKQDRKYWERHSVNDKFIIPDEAVSLGLADEIIGFKER